ncbi:helix-turn-helix domain-containing protein [Levyella massiliensis]|uniref:helix-turn-helix domain-containing protein n=1 Tax=Levyella massiliensis TaxID=938289 RepID=UPI0024AE55C2|nr:helix-turn-helix domain-containing protein [Levyella massiliensis]
MRELISNAENRRLFLLEYFIYGSPCVAVEDLKKTLNMSDSTLIADIEKMKAMYPDLSLSISDGKIRAYFAPTFQAPSIYVPITQNKLIFRLVTRIFFEENLSLTTLAVQEHASVSSAYRVVHDFNAIAEKQYQVHIENNPCHMVGTENAIRAFYRDFFLEVYTGENQPFSVDILHACREFIKDFSPFLQELTHLCPRMTLGFMIATAVTRILQGHRIKDLKPSQDFRKLYAEFSNKPDFEAIQNHYERCLGIKITEESLVDIFYPTLNEGYRLQNHPNKETKADQIIKQMLNDLAQENDIPLTRTTELANSISNGLFLANYGCFHPVIIFNGAAILCMSAWHNHKVFAQSALRHLQDLQEKINKTSSQASSIYLFYILLGSWPDLLRNLRLKYKKLHVKIESHLGPAHEHFVKETLLRFFNSFADFELYTDALEEAGAPKTIDLLITNFSHPNLSGDKIEYTFHIRDNFLSSEALFEIGDMIRNIYNERNGLVLDIQTFMRLFHRFEGMGKDLPFAESEE